MVNYGTGGTSDPTQFRPETYGAKGDGTFILAAQVSGTALTATPGAGPFPGFTPADTGKSILIGNGVKGGVVATITPVSAGAATLSVSGGTLTSVPAVYGTDDSAALNTAITQAAAYAAANGQATVKGTPGKWYCAASPTIKTSANKGNAQFPVPLVQGSATSVRYPLIYDFGNGAPVNPMFAGATTIPAQGLGGGIVCMLNGLASDGTWGAPSVIGGPTPQQGFGESNNAAGWNLVMPVIRGLNIIYPLDPTIIGLDFRGCAAARPDTYACWPLDTIQNIQSTGPTSQYGAGLLMPNELNNVEAWVGDVSVYGSFVGTGLWAHSTVQSAKAIYCVIGHFIGGDGNDKHGMTAQYLCAEGVQQGLQTDGNSGITIPVDIGMLDIEAAGFWNGSGNFQGQAPAHISDPSNGLGGHIGVNDNSGGGSVLTITGGANCEIIAVHQARGIAAPPSVPLTTVALKNPFWRHATVNITSGGAAVTVIAVNGTATGLTLGTTGTVSVRVPSGATIALTYASTAPTWTWNLD